MGFLDRIRKGKLYFGKKTPLIVVQFLFRGKTYILEEFDMSFSQDEDTRTQDGSAGNLISITISEPADENINQWMVNAYEKRDGEFRFFVNTPRITESAALFVSFRDAYCIAYHKEIHPVGAGLLTRLTILPGSVKIDSEEFEIGRKI
jgi:hypothetical protein